MSTERKKIIKMAVRLFQSLGATTETALLPLDSNFDLRTTSCSWWDDISDPGAELG